MQSREGRVSHQDKAHAPKRVSSLLKLGQDSRTVPGSHVASLSWLVVIVFFVFVFCHFVTLFFC